MPTTRRYVLIDGPGLGLSGPLTRISDIDGAAGAALDVLAALGVTEPVDWIGNAFGGHVGYKLGAMPRVLRGIRRPHRASMSNAVKSFILNRVDVTAELADIIAPCLFIASDDRGDWAPAGAENAARLTPNAVAATVPGARTLVPLEQPAEVARLVTGFWARLD